MSREKAFKRGAIRAPQVIDFLGHLLRHLPGKLLVVWDGLPAHRAQLAKQFIAEQHGRLVERLPAYAPELNPVEHLWGYWKQHELPNFCPRDFAQLSYQARRPLRRMRRRPLSALTPAQYGDLAEVPPEIERFANITNSRNPAYKIDVHELSAYAGLRGPRGAAHRGSRRYHEVNRCRCQTAVKKKLKRRHLRAYPEI